MSVEAEVPGESGRAASDLSEDSPSLPGVFIPDGPSAKRRSGTHFPIEIS